MIGVLEHLFIIIDVEVRTVKMLRRREQEHKTNRWD